jgi:hypothetical protein
MTEKPTDEDIREFIVELEARKMGCRSAICRVIHQRMIECCKWCLGEEERP